MFLEDILEVMHGASEKLGSLYDTYLSAVNNLFKNAEIRLAKSFTRIYSYQFVCNVRLLIGYEG